MSRVPMWLKIALGLSPSFVVAAVVQVLLHNRLHGGLHGGLQQGEALLLAAPLLLPAVMTPTIVTLVSRLRMRGLVATMQRVAAGELATPLPPPPSRDFAMVANSFATMQRALAEAMARLRTIDSQRRRFFADLAHELATPVSSILGLCDTLSSPDLYGSLDPQLQQRLLLSLGEEAQRVGDLTRSLSELAHLEDPDVQLHRSRVDLAPRVHRIVERLNLESGARIACQVEPALACVDVARSEQVLVNLLSNARRYTPPQGEIQVQLRSVEDGIELVVQDGGPGVPEALLARLGERLLRLDPSRDRRTGGHGLGLSIVRQIVRRHGGRLEFRNGSGGGLRAGVWLPRDERPPSSEEPASF